MMPAPPRASQRAAAHAGAGPGGGGLAGTGAGGAGPAGTGPRSAPGSLHERPHLHIVPPARRLGLTRRVIVSALSVGFASLLMALVGLHVLIAQEQFRLDSLQNQAATDQASYEKLRLAVAELESPARIVSVAEGSLGMRQPGSVTYLPPLPASTASARQAPAPGSSASGGTAALPSQSSAGVVPAPPGDADWPAVKPYLSGSP